jgi:hypothetical protein
VGAGVSVGVSVSYLKVREKISAFEPPTPQIGQSRGGSAFKAAAQTQHNNDV